MLLATRTLLKGWVRRVRAYTLGPIIQHPFSSDTLSSLHTALLRTMRYYIPILTGIIVPCVVANKKIDNRKYLTGCTFIPLKPRENPS